MREQKGKKRLLLIPFDLRQRYEFAITSATLEVFETLIPQYYTFNEMNILTTINEDEEFQEDIRILHLDTLEGDSTSPLETFYTRGEITLVTFFSLQMIDIPKPFSRAKSLYTATASSPKLRFLNMLTRHGRKSKVLKAYSFSLQSISKSYFSSTAFSIEANDWRFIYSIFNQTHSMAPADRGEGLRQTFKSPTESYFTKYSDEYSQSKYVISGEEWLQDNLFASIAEYVPIFSFYVKKVDKLKRRHSRGKSGKYSIAWKYIPRYRRLLVTLRWLAQDVRFQKAKTFELRLLRSLESFLFDRESHLVPRLRQFVHSFVFQYHKKNLLKTLKSVA